MDLKDIKKVEFVFENIESLSFPIELIEQLELKEVVKESGSCYEVETIVVFNDNVKLGLFDELDNPIDRLYRYSDITSLEITDTQGNVKSYYVRWDGSNEFDNGYQKSELLKWNKVKILIKKNNKEYHIEELLSGDFPDGSRFVDENWKEYVIRIKNENVFLENQIVNRELLEKTFKEV